MFNRQAEINMFNCWTKVTLIHYGVINSRAVRVIMQSVVNQSKQWLVVFTWVATGTCLPIVIMLANVTSCAVTEL